MGENKRSGTKHTIIGRRFENYETGHHNYHERRSMAIPVFLSHPKPCNTAQIEFIESIRVQLADRHIEAKTLGVGDYDMNAPLAGIRRLMLESNGILVIAFARYEIKSGRKHFTGDNGACNSASINNTWMTSPWCQIESGMGFQLGLPILVLRENGVLPDGVLETGVLGTYMPEFNLVGDPTAYLESPEARQLFQQFESQVIQYRDRKGVPVGAKF